MEVVDYNVRYQWDTAAMDLSPSHINCPRSNDNISIEAHNSICAVVPRVLMLFLLGVFVLVAVAVSVLVAFVAITWEHDIVQSYAALPAPADLGTQEFRWRCWLSPLTRRGWRTSILRSPCPRITLQCPFALLSADFAKLATSLSLPKLALEQLPFVFPQVAVGSLFLQLLGNSHFPASVRGIRLKALTVVQLRPLNMSFPSQDGDTPTAPELTVRRLLSPTSFLSLARSATNGEANFLFCSALLRSVSAVRDGANGEAVPRDGDRIHCADRPARRARHRLAVGHVVLHPLQAGDVAGAAVCVFICT